MLLRLRHARRHVLMRATITRSYSMRDIKHVIDLRSTRLCKRRARVRDDVAREGVCPRIRQHALRAYARRSIYPCALRKRLARVCYRAAVRAGK